MQVSARLQPTSKLPGSVGLALLLLIGCSHTLHAQTSSPRSTGAAPGGDGAGTGRRDGLTLLVDLSGRRESEVPARLRGFVPVNDAQGDGLSTMAVGAAAYARNRRRFQLIGSALTAFEYYQGLDRLDPVSHSAGIGAGIQLARQGSVQFDQKVAYSPSYLYRLFPSVTAPAAGEAMPVNPEYRID